MIPRFLSILVLVPFVLSAGGCEAVEKAMSRMDRPAVRVAGMDLAGLSLDGVDLVFDLEVSNPYQVPLPVAGLDYALSSGGNAFLSGQSTHQGLIPAGGRERIPLSARVAFADTMRLLSGVRPGAIVPYTAKVGISVDAPGAGLLRLPVETSGSFPVPAVPRISIQQIAWRELALTQAAGVILLGIGNENEFPLDIERLSYSLSLMGMPLATSSLARTLSLGPGRSGVLEVPFSFRPLDAGAAALQTLGGGDADWSLSGTLSALTPFGSMGLPVSGQGRAPMVR